MHQDTYDGTERRSGLTADITILSSRLQTLHNDVSDIKGTLKDLTNAITKLALVEERITNAVAAQERAFKAIDKISERLELVEAAQAANSHTTIWVDRAVMTIVGAAIMFIWEKVTKN
jgi:uncharacterized protein YoxC